MTDAELICTFMEPHAPKDGTGYPSGVLKKFSPEGWWRYSMVSCLWKLPTLTVGSPLESLGRLHLVEERLTERQWRDYQRLLTEPVWSSSNPAVDGKAMIHATAEQKIRALAAVLREQVENNIL